VNALEKIKMKFLNTSSLIPGIFIFTPGAFKLMDLKLLTHLIQQHAK